MPWLERSRGSSRLRPRFRAPLTRPSGFEVNPLRNETSIYFRAEQPFLSPEPLLGERRAPVHLENQWSDSAELSFVKIVSSRAIKRFRKTGSPRRTSCAVSQNSSEISLVGIVSSRARLCESRNFPISHFFSFLNLSSRSFDSSDLVPEFLLFVEIHKFRKRIPIDSGIEFPLSQSVWSSSHLGGDSHKELATAVRGCPALIYIIKSGHRFSMWGKLDQASHPHLVA